MPPFSYVLKSMHAFKRYDTILSFISRAKYVYTKLQCMQIYVMHTWKKQCKIMSNVHMSWVFLNVYLYKIIICCLVELKSYVYCIYASVFIIISWKMIYSASLLLFSLQKNISLNECKQSVCLCLCVLEQTMYVI